MRKWDAEPTLTLEGGEEGGVGASEVGEGACFWISVGRGSGISTRRVFQQKQDTLWGRQGLTVKTVPQATGRLESSKGSAQGCSMSETHNLSRVPCAFHLTYVPASVK